MTQHYQSGGMKPSHYRTPRMRRDGCFTEESPLFQQETLRPTGWLAWSGWIAFALLLLSTLAGRSQ